MRFLGRKRRKINAKKQILNSTSLFGDKKEAQKQRLKRKERGGKDRRGRDGTSAGRKDWGVQDWDRRPRRLPGGCGRRQIVATEKEAIGSVPHETKERTSAAEAALQALSARLKPCP
jgi:hypothetical protein